MRVDEFEYDLPEELIAQEPAARRDASRLLVLDRETGATEHRAFGDLPELLAPGDLLVVNDTRVRPARLRGRKTTGGAVELLLLEPESSSGEAVWSCLARPARGLRPGSVIAVAEGLSVVVLARENEGFRIRLEERSGGLARAVERWGVMPLPPYIRRLPGDPRDALDRERYQTVFARRPGAVAAPTAGLHFTPEVLRGLDHRGLEVAALTLHVGPGTFLPVRVRHVESHRMHAEAFEIPEAAAAAVGAARARGGRVVAVGTTVVRALEGSARGEGTVRPASGRCDLFIYPGFRFRVVDALVTNFHLPRSTLLMLVSAFAGRERVLAAYREAVARRYRFYSYGDAMLVRGVKS